MTNTFGVEHPVIRSIEIQGTNALITVHIPNGLRRVTLETKARAGEGAWVSRELKWPDGKVGEFTFQLPANRDLELIRVNGTDTASMPLPAKFYLGNSKFSAAKVPGPTTTDGVAPSRGNVFAEDASSSTGNLYLSTAGTAIIGQPVGTIPRAVVESDIWQLRGSTLYFFNQNRGLQVIDVSNPDAPALQGTLALAAAGEQMYVLPWGAADGSEYIALLAADGCDGRQSQIVVVEVVQGQPREVVRMGVTGSIRESRLVGTALYLAGQQYGEIEPARTGPNNSFIPAVWGGTTTVQSYDLANPRLPKPVSSISLAVYPQAIQATEDYLLVATTASYRSVPLTNGQPWEVNGANAVLLYDIRDPAGLVKSIGSVLTAGRVADKFKMNVRNDVLSVVSQKDSTWPQSTWLENFSMTQPGNPVGRVKLIENESLYATRYDGNRLYAVTFRQVDPLWIVDLTNPERPEILSELQVPGFSTYIHPMGDRLITMGQDGGAAVSLFDVADARHPKLLSRVKLGEWSWSEANTDEKAFKVLSDAGLILVPWSGWKNQGGSGSYFQGMQLVDFSREALKIRGHIEHQFQARRATVHQSRILSLSGTELISVDAADRDNLVVRAKLELSPRVDRVWVAGEFLLSWIQGEMTGTNVAPSRLQVARTSAPDNVIGSLSLSNAVSVISDQSSDRLHLLLQAVTTYKPVPVQYTNTWIQIDQGDFRSISVTNKVSDWTSASVVERTQLEPLIETFGVPPVFGGYVDDNSTPVIRWIPQPDIITTNEFKYVVQDWTEPGLVQRDVVSQVISPGRGSFKVLNTVVDSEMSVAISGPVRLVVLDLSTLPSLAPREVELPALTVLGADFRDGRLNLLQVESAVPEFSYSLVTNQASIPVYPEPTFSFATNQVVKTVQLASVPKFMERTEVLRLPPLPLIEVRTNVQVVQLPPLPGEIDPKWITNVVVRKVETTFDPVPVTNQIWTVTWEPGGTRDIVHQSVVVNVNQTVEYENVPVVMNQLVSQDQPGTAHLTLVDIPAVGPLSILGRTQLAKAQEFQQGYGYTAHQPKPGVLVWTSAQASTYYPKSGGIRYMPIYRTLVFGGNFSTRLAVSDSTEIRLSPVWGGWTGAFQIYPWDSRPQTRNFWVCDVQRPTEPRFGGQVRMGTNDSSTSGFSEVFTAGEQMFVSRSRSTYVPPVTNIVWVTNSNGGSYQQWVHGTYEYRYFLEVLDFRNDGVMPVIKAPAEFPGTLKGLSHGGALLYAERGTESNWGGGGIWFGDLFPQVPVLITMAPAFLDALAYDGQAASLVSSLELKRSTYGNVVYRLNDDGTVWMPTNPGTNMEPANLEVWAVSEDAAFARYQQVPLGAETVTNIQMINDAVVLELLSGDVQFLRVAGSRQLTPLARWHRSCNFWTDWSTAAGSAAGGIWFPRGIFGLWHADTQP